MVEADGPGTVTSAAHQNAHDHNVHGSNNKVAHKRNKAKVQVNNFLDDDLAEAACDVG